MRRKLEFEEDGRGTKKASVWVGVGGEKINIEVEGEENGDGGHASPKNESQGRVVCSCAISKGQTKELVGIPFRKYCSYGEIRYDDDSGDRKVF